MSLAKLLDQRPINELVIKSIENFENILGVKLPSNLYDFIGQRDYDKDIIAHKLTCRNSYTTPDGQISFDENTISYNSYSYYTYKGEKYWQPIRFFCDIKRNLYMISGVMAPEIKDLMLRKKIIFIADIYDTMYWCMSLEEENFGKIFFIDIWEEEQFFAFNTFEEFLESIFIGIITA